MLLKGLHGLSLHGQPSLGMQVSDGDWTSLQCCRDVPAHRQSPGAQKHPRACREQRLPTLETTAVPALQEVLLKAERCKTLLQKQHGDAHHIVDVLESTSRPHTAHHAELLPASRNACAWTGLRVFKWIKNNYLCSTNRIASASEQMGICNKLWQSRVPSHAGTSSAPHEAVCAPWSCLVPCTSPSCPIPCTCQRLQVIGEWHKAAWLHGMAGTCLPSPCSITAGCYCTPTGS